ncbi:cobalt-precorrin 5A hydrolase [Alkaliphilus peptidifermentans]|uniref:Cobalt-precorrin 5A hydrolase n=1 Tax=Alkaliphilus peptidifermentans DSM 18978 TaxID=1120976 RepID=A0A1G5AQB6_9FIRM|nr:cobalt-precorrin 5A hydrolase [Alkaliphilus peptidifermentans]SCX80087.1 cobalt-precorrin 5A hydrolase [Alkaliphilus peptidifermentans DSM 18978]
MKTAIFTLTKGGKAQGLRLKEFIPDAKIYVKPQLKYPEDETLPLIEPIASIVEKNFNENDLLIFIMATGIVVRLIAPFLKHKAKDPALLVMDEAGKNLISLLAGHTGGANEWTLKLADLIKANPVITTASDTLGIEAVDTFCKNNHLNLSNWSLAKEITAYLINGGAIPVYIESADINPTLPHNYYRVKDKKELKEKPFGLFIGNNPTLELPNNILQLFPKNLVIGIGCRRGIAKELLMKELIISLEEINKFIYSIVKIATVDVKKDEKALQEVASELKVPIEIIHRDKLREVENLFQTSEFVQRTIGVGSVAEPCAYLGSNGGKMLLKKRKNNGITISIAEMNMEVKV